MKIDFLFKLALKNISRNKKRSLFSSLAISFAVSILIFVFSFIDGMLADMKATSLELQTGNVRLENINYLKYEKFHPSHLNIVNSSAIIKKLKQTKDLLISPRIILYSSALLKDSDSDAENGIGYGIDLKFENKYRKFSSKIIKGKVFSSEDAIEALISYGFADKLKLKVGDDLNVNFQTSRRSITGVTFKIVGIIAVGDLTVDFKSYYIPIKTAQRFMLMDENNAFSNILLLKTNPKETQKEFFARMQAIKELQREDLVLRDWREVSPIYNLIQSVRLIQHGFIGGFFILLSSTVIISSILMIIFERKKEIGMLMAIGMKKKEIRNLFLVESFLISLLGSLVGFIFGIAIVIIFEKIGLDLSAYAKFAQFPISKVFHPKPNWIIVIATPILACVLATLICIFPVNSVTKLRPTEALLGK